MKILLLIPIIIVVIGIMLIDDDFDKTMDGYGSTLGDTLDTIDSFEKENENLYDD